MRDLENSVKTELRDGTPVEIRQITPEDKEALRRGLDQLSPRSRHFRFFTVKKGFTEEELKNLTEIDHHDHDAWGAVDLSLDPPKPIGIGRYVRHEPGGDTAEFAVTVLDSYQGRGLGSLLFGTIAARARHNGIWRLHSVELSENHPLFDMLEGLEAENRFQGHGESEVVVELYDDPAAYPQTTAGDIMRAATSLYRQACA